MLLIDLFIGFDNFTKPQPIPSHRDLNPNPPLIHLPIRTTTKTTFEPSRRRTNHNPRATTLLQQTVKMENKISFGQTTKIPAEILPTAREVTPPHKVIFKMWWIGSQGTTKAAAKS